MQGIVWILFFYLLGCVVSALTGNFIPGSVVGMLLLFGALSAGWLRPWRMKRAAGFLLDNMMLFFIPVGVGLIASYSLVSKYLAAILVASIVSTVLVIVVVGMIEQKARRQAPGGFPHAGKLRTPEPRGIGDAGSGRPPRDRIRPEPNPPLPRAPETATPSNPGRHE